MTHDDCGLWFAQLEDVFSSLGITSQTNKFAALTTLLTEEEAYVVRGLTLLGRESPADVFDTARMLFVQRFELTIHQRFTRAFAIGGVDVNEKPSPGSGTQVAIGHETMSSGGLSSGVCRHLCLYYKMADAC